MQIRSRRAAIAAVPLAAALVLAACSSDETDTGSTDSADSTDSAAEECTPLSEFDTITDGVLAVAIPDLAPISIFESETSATGIDAEIVEAIAELQCIEIAYSSQSYASAIPETQSGRTDVTIGGYYRTAIRAEVVALSDPLYLDTMGLISADGVSTIPELEEDRSVGTVDGYLWVSELRDVLGDSLSVYPSNVEMFQDYEAGRIDVAIDGFAPAVLYTEDSGDELFAAQPDERISSTIEPAQIGFPHTITNTALTDALNEAIAILHEDGTIVSILEAYNMDPALADVGEPRIIE